MNSWASWGDPGSPSSQGLNSIALSSPGIEFSGLNCQTGYYRDWLLLVPEQLVILIAKEYSIVYINTSFPLKNSCLFLQVDGTRSGHIKRNNSEGWGQIPDDLMHLSLIEKQSKTNRIEWWQTTELQLQNWCYQVGWGRVRRKKETRMVVEGL